MRILFMEDTGIWISTYTMFLEKMFGLKDEVKHLVAGDDAPPVLDDVPFDVIICDHYMPGDLGNSVYAHARYSEQSLNKETPFIHHSSMPCPRDYKGSSMDKNFYILSKDGNVRQLFYLLCDLGVNPIMEFPE